MLFCVCSSLRSEEEEIHVTKQQGLVPFEHNIYSIYHKCLQRPVLCMSSVIKYRILRYGIYWNKSQLPWTAFHIWNYWLQDSSHWQVSALCGIFGGPVVELRRGYSSFSALGRKPLLSLPSWDSISTHFFVSPTILTPWPLSQKLDWSFLLAEHIHRPSELSIIQCELPDEK